MAKLSIHLETLNSEENKWRTDKLRKSDVKEIRKTGRAFDRLGFIMSKAQTSRMVTRCQSPEPLSHSEMAQLVRDLNLRIEDECEQFFFLVLNKNEADYFITREDFFSKEFSEKFPKSGIYELDEAAKCYALSRYTACVFHLMRVLEIGISAMSMCLGVPDPIKPSERNWGSILKSIKASIEAKWTSPTDKNSPDAILFASLYTTLDAVRNPWRNATMHVENKYTQEEAEHIFVAVKIFMKKLSFRCDEDGNPKIGY